MGCALMGFLKYTLLIKKQRLLYGWPFLALLAAVGKILTIDNLRKRYVIVVYKYCMCKR
jgi:hypothetical protein